MATISQIIDRYAREAGKASPRYLHNRAANVFASNDTLYSYGYHFPLATVMPDLDGNPRGWWLVNGDSYSVSTARHQGETRRALAGTGLDRMIVPFSALGQARINRKSIAPVEITDDTWTEEPVTVPLSRLPEYMRDNPSYWGVRDNGNGSYTYTRRVHHLGEAVFRATSYDPDQDGEAYYLSAFDDQEGEGLYFLAQLPAGAVPASVTEAREALKPAEVREAEALGLSITRQGEIFAIPTRRETRRLPGPSLKRAYLLGHDHNATEVRMLDGATYARGILRHRPRDLWRNPEHRMRKMGDGKSWHRIVLNTVPEGRSWSVGGNVD